MGRIIEVDEDYIAELKWKLEQSRIRCANLEAELDKAKDENSSLDFRIRTELEPRLKQEAHSYDLWVSQQTGAEECEHFSSLVEDMIDFVKEHDGCFDWGDPNGDLEGMILYLIYRREDANTLYIEEKDSNDT